MKRWVEYIWLDHDNNYRSKTRILNDDGSAGSFSISKLPIWNFDGSSTEQADGEDSEVYIKPVYMVRDPFRRQCDSWLVLCDTWLPDGNPHPDNTRVNAMKIFSQKVVRESETWFGLEQEFFIRKAVKSYPVGMDKNLYSKSATENIQGPYYCGVGKGNCATREFMEEAVQHMVDSGLNITGLNFEVAPGQAEFQIMNAGIDAADELHMARYILIRTAEQKDLFIDFHPKPFKTKGLITLMNHMPNALVVPVSINNSWKTLSYGKFPMGLGAHIKFRVHRPIPVNSEESKTLIKHIEQTIINDINYDE